jgi:hypothetical protein
MNPVNLKELDGPMMQRCINSPFPRLSGLAPSRNEVHDRIIRETVRSVYSTTPTDDFDVMWGNLHDAFFVITPDLLVYTHDVALDEFTTILDAA